MSEILYEKCKLSSFDKNYTTEVYLKHPDKYRQLEKDSLKNWPLFRIFLTTLRHLTISLLLSMPYDASGAFRYIDCRKVVLSDLILAKNNSYAFFWESIFVLHKKKYRI